MSPRALLVAAALAAAGPAVAEPAKLVATTDVFASTDADHTDITKWGLDLDLQGASSERYRGGRIELARFAPLGGATQRKTRVYLRAADVAADWRLAAQLGTDGDTALGALSLHDKAWSREVFVERDIVETPQGLSRGVYFTYAGVAFDAPLSARDTLTLVSAAQAFTGRNVRLHARANLVHVLSREAGVTAQLRTRYFHSTRPGEFDYFSPRDFVQVTPTLQLRRRFGGWRGLVSAGLGGQRQTGAGWKQARAANAQLETPIFGDGWRLEGRFAYTNTPITAAYTYDYREFSLALRRAF